MRTVIVAVAIALAAVAIYARATAYGLFSDDFQWLVGAEQFHPARLVDLANRNHFYRPVPEVYFPAALAACGHAGSCYHWFNIALHILTSALVAGLARAISKTSAIGALAGILCAVQPAPTEAVVWVSAVSEVMATALFVLTVWLFWQAWTTHSRAAYVGALLSFLASLLTHESAVTLIAVLALTLWILPREASSRDERTSRTHSGRLMRLLPFLVGFAAYAWVAYIVNSRNYLVAEGQYGFGTHVFPNILNALVTFAVARRELAALVVTALVALVAAIAGPPRVRFYMLWVLITLIPAAGFRDGMSSRYLYLPAAGFAALVAEVLWSSREWLMRRSWARVGLALWWIATIGLTLRFATFAVKNVRALERAGDPFREYATNVRALYPMPSRGARLDVPAPPVEIPPRYVPTLLQWEYDDITLDVVVHQ